MNVGDLVTFRGSIGIVVGKVESAGAHPNDVWVWWNDEYDQPKWECGLLLEKANECR